MPNAYIILLHPIKLSLQSFFSLLQLWAQIFTILHQLSPENKFFPSSFIILPPSWNYPLNFIVVLSPFVAQLLVQPTRILTPAPHSYINFFSWKEHSHGRPKFNYEITDSEQNKTFLLNQLAPSERPILTSLCPLSTSCLSRLHQNTPLGSSTITPIYPLWTKNTWDFHQSIPLGSPILTTFYIYQKLPL